MTCPDCKAVFAFALPEPVQGPPVECVSCPRCANRDVIEKFRPRLVNADTKTVENALGISLSREAQGIDLRKLV